MLFFAGDGPEDSPSSPPNKSDLQKVEDRSAVQALDSTGLQKLVKRKIGLLLKTHKALEAARLANAQPLDGPPNQERALQLPLGVDRKAMTEHLETFEKSEARHAALGRAVFEGVLRQNIADFERSRAAVDLHNTLELISKVHPEFCHDEVFVAALHLSDRLPRQGSSEPLDQLVVVGAEVLEIEGVDPVEIVFLRDRLRRRRQRIERLQRYPLRAGQIRRWNNARNFGQPREFVRRGFE